MQNFFYKLVNDNAIEDEQSKQEFEAAIAHLQTEEDDQEIVEVYFAGFNRDRDATVTVAFFRGWSAAQNNGTPIYAHTVTFGLVQSTNTSSEVYCSDAEVLRRVFGKTWSQNFVVSEVMIQLIESRDEAYAPYECWFDHKDFGKACFYQDLCEFRVHE